MNAAVPSTGDPPLIGLLVFDKSPRLHLPPLRIRGLAAEAMMQGARLVLFSGDDCDPGAGTLMAEHWLNQAWVKRLTRWPDIVIVATNPRNERKQRVDAWVRAQGPVVCDIGPDKLELPALLAATSLARHVIPQERIEANEPVRQIESWLNRKGDAVVKPVSGKRGTGIVRLHKEEDGRFRLLNNNGTQHFASAAEAASEVGRQIMGRLHYRNYLLQAYVCTVAPDGRAADIRVHIQRDELGEWQVTRSYVRLGEAGAATSNISKGGYQAELTHFLAARQTRDPTLLATQAERLARAVADEIERARGMCLSELGVDIAIDPDDQLWVIEANTRPQSSLHEQLRSIRTIGYAIHLVNRCRFGTASNQTMAVRE